MLTVSEQLQRYRLQQAAKKGGLTEPVRLVMSHHPTTRDYFQSLMQRWQKRAEDSHDKSAADGR